MHVEYVFHNAIFSYIAEQEKGFCSRIIEAITQSKALSVKYTAVTEEEKKTIVKALGLSQGHWFKCPKGIVQFTCCESAIHVIFQMCMRLCAHGNVSVRFQL